MIPQQSIHATTEKHNLGYKNEKGDWVGMLTDCITLVNFSLLVNRVPTKTFYPKRGMNFGDPISFILCAESFLALLLKGSRTSKLIRCQIARSSPSISHLFFAYDSLLFYKASPKACCLIKKILKIYEAGLGQ